MRRLNCNLILKNIKLYHNINRPLCQLNKLVQTPNTINTSLNKYVSLTTSLVNQEISILSRKYCSPPNSHIDSITFERVCDETLESLCEYMEELVENASHLQSTDVTYSSGVLTVNFGDPYGTYVINRQSPNHQIWLSSPTSGPKRYDFDPKDNTWVYKHDNVPLHKLLQDEIKDIVRTDIDFSRCAYSQL